MKNNFTILKTLPFALFLIIFFVSALVLYQLKNAPKNIKSIKSELIGKNIPEILINISGIFLPINSDLIDFIFLGAFFN